MRSLLTVSLFAHLAFAAPSVTLDYGTFTGLTNPSTNVTSYRGVRYADAPIGNLRWRAPITPPSTKLGTVDATKFGNACISTTQTTVSSGTSEDCLFGNIYVPPGANASALPVLVWFHGGGFQGGSTHDIAPDPILTQASASKVIFVSFEYRLGQFGFLGGPQVQADGALNAGLLDQRAALRWVQRYISFFGGDKTRVTIWGQSAGAGSTMFQLLGEGGSNDGLFRAAIGDSPSLSYLPSSNDTYVKDIFSQFSGFAGCSGADAEKLACLRAAPSAKLTLAGSQTILARPATLYTFAPLFDNIFLRDRPTAAFTSGRFARVPVLFGSNTNEGAGWSASLADPNANTSNPNATQTTVYNFIHGQFAAFTRAAFDRAVATFYPLSVYNGSFSLQGQQMYGEMRYICTAALITGAAGAGAGWHYHYNNPGLGSGHGAELQAFFTATPPSGDADRTLFAEMKEYWTGFAAASKPGGSGPVWTPTTKTNGSPRMLLQPGSVGLENLTPELAARCAFWHSIAAELGQ